MIKTILERLPGWRWQHPARRLLDPAARFDASNLPTTRKMRRDIGIDEIRRPTIRDDFSRNAWWY